MRDLDFGILPEYNSFELVGVSKAGHARPCCIHLSHGWRVGTLMFYVVAFDLECLIRSQIPIFDQVIHEKGNGVCLSRSSVSSGDLCRLLKWWQ